MVGPTPLSYVTDLYLGAGTQISFSTSKYYKIIGFINFPNDTFGREFVKPAIENILTFPRIVLKVFVIIFSF